MATTSSLSGVTHRVLGSAPSKVAGIHLSGANTKKTAVVILSGDLPREPLRIIEVYEKIGSYGRLFSDDRLVQILALAAPLSQVFVDCPLTVPPCMACTRTKCPGVAACDDISVNYMMALAERGSLDKSRKHRPINPQSQRLWDVFEKTEGQKDGLEPTFHPNALQQTARARTLQRRLRHAQPEVELRETSVNRALWSLATTLKMPAEELLRFRSFETGLDTRKKAFMQLVGSDLVVDPEHDTFQRLTRTVEGFQAMITGLTAALYQNGLCEPCPAHFVERDGWVFTPSPRLRASVP